MSANDAFLAELQALLESAGPAFSDAAAGAVLALEAGRCADALAALDRLAAERPEAAFLYVLRAQAHSGLKDYAAAQADLGTVIERAPAAWVYLQRARLFEELGSIGLALDDVDAAIKAFGADAELLTRRAHLQVCRRHYELAVEDYTRLAALTPDDPGAYLGRGSVLSIQGRPDLAVADFRKAEELCGGDGRLRLQRLHLQIQSGGGEGLRAELEELAKEPDLEIEAAFELGCLELKRRAFREAGDAFGKAGQGRAAYYKTVARLLQEAPAPRPPMKEGIARLNICGLGAKPPFTVTADVLNAILECDFVFNNLSEPEVADLIHLLSPSSRPTMFDIRGGGAKWTKAIFTEVRPGRTVGFVTRGHPLVCGGLAANLIRAADAEGGIEYKVFSAVSSMDALPLGAWRAADGVLAGGQVIDYSVVVSEPFSLDVSAPAVVYFNASIFDLAKEPFLDFCGKLEARYPEGHTCLFYGRRFDVAPATIALKELRGHHGRIDPSFTLVIPPVEKVGAPA